MKHLLFIPALSTLLLAQGSGKVSAASLAAPAFTNSVGMAFLRVAPGSFTMGSPAGGEAAEGPAHKVTLGKGFFMGTHEVTQAQWKTVMGTSPSSFPGDNRPVEHISWKDAKAFVAKLTEMEQGRNEYRLPSEAEWEYACRAGASGPEGEVESLGWIESNAGGATHPVGQKKANAWGFYDMLGNAWEWCEDTWHDTYQGAPADGSAWSTGGDGAKRVLRGGSWAFGASDARSASRMAYGADSRVGDSLGLRVVLVPKG